jgi:ubiquinone/menaquinone biosynthesis C-methylase UbiE
VAAKTDYDALAADYDRRYEARRYEGIGATLSATCAAGQRVLEVGCGTGHWLAQLEASGCDAVGLEPSAAMLDKARARGLRAELVHGRAESLPFADASFDRVLCINAIHHFDDVGRFVAEARRVLRAGGVLLSIALDPSIGRDRWSIYDYFTETRSIDLARCRPAKVASDLAHSARRSALGARRSVLGARRTALGARRTALGARCSVLGAVIDDIIASLQVSPGLGDVECGEGFARRTKRRLIARASSPSRTARAFRQVEQDTCGGTPELTGEISVVSSDACRDRTKPDQYATCAFINGQVWCGSDFVHALGLSASAM